MKTVQQEGKVRSGFWGKTIAQAYMWVNLAAAQGVDDAVRMRDNLVKKLTASQIEEGQRLAREWIAKHPQAQVAQ